MIRYDPPGSRVLGKRWEFAISVTDANGQLKDLTGATVTLAVGSSPAHRYDSAAAVLADQEDETGQALAVFTPAETALLPIPTGGQMFYQVDVYYDAAHVDTVAWGYFRVQASLI